MEWRNLFAVAALAIVVSLGCSSEAPPPPQEVQDAETTDEAPDVDLGTPVDEAEKPAVDSAPAVDPNADAPPFTPPATDGAAKSGATLRGKFVYDGEAPAAVKLAVTKDEAVCSKHSPMDETLVVGPDGGIANIFVWVRSKNVASDSAADETIVLDNKGCSFAPHASVIHTGQKVELKNSDPVGHNSNIATTANPAKNFSIPPHGSVEVDFEVEERMPSKVSCGIHPWMTSWILITDDAYAAVTKPDGSFEISGLPIGEEFEFQIWQEKAGYLSDVTIDGADPDWSRGRFEKKIEGDIDLGVIKVAPKAFES